MNTLPPHAQDGNPLQKRCYACKTLLPATLEFFHCNKRKKDGLEGACKKCKQSYYRGKHPLTHGQEIPEGQKQCSQCKECKPATTDYFHRHKDGLLSKCKDCCHEWRKNHREQAQAYHKAYYSNPDVQERKHAYEKARRDNPETREDVLARKRESWARRQAQLKAYYQRPEVRARKNANTRKRYYDPIVGPRVREQKRARTLRYQANKQAVSGTYTFEQIQEKLKAQKYKCYYCSDKFIKKNDRYIYHIDHTFPLSRVEGTDIPANDISYLVLTCPPCNLSKGSKFPWEWPEGGKLL